MVERFLTFIPIAHTGASLTTTVLTFLNKCCIDIKNLQEQSIHNASNMSRRYNGLQAHIKIINNHAHYIPCAACSLNLVGVCAVENCITATPFFEFVTTLYTFFSASTQLWKVMLKYLQYEDSEGQQGSACYKVVSRVDATKPLSRSYSFQKAH